MHRELRVAQARKERRCKAKTAAGLQEIGERKGMLREPDRPSSLSTLAVYEITKGCAIIAASFLQVANKLPAEAYLTVPCQTLVDLLEERETQQGKRDLLKAVVCRAISAWIVAQNRRHGVAPGRRQLAQKAETLIPAALPATIQKRLRNRYSSNLRTSQQRWFSESFQSQACSAAGSESYVIAGEAEQGGSLV